MKSGYLYLHKFEPFVGAHRGPFELNGWIIVVDLFISDFEYRPLKERLFSWPWKPWEKYCYRPKCFVCDNKVLVTVRTYDKLKRMIEPKNES